MRRLTIPRRPRLTATAATLAVFACTLMLGVTPAAADLITKPVESPSPTSSPAASPVPAGGNGDGSGGTTILLVGGGALVVAIGAASIVGLRRLSTGKRPDVTGKGGPPHASGPGVGD